MERYLDIDTDRAYLSSKAMALVHILIGSLFPTPGTAATGGRNAPDSGGAEVWMGSPEPSRHVRGLHGGRSMSEVPVKVEGICRVDRELIEDKIHVGWYFLS